MKISKVALQLYLFTSITTVIAAFFDWKWIEFIIKPIIIPAIFYYYTQINKIKFSLVLVILLILNFASDMMAVFDYENKAEIIILLNFIANLILTYFFVSDLFIIKNFDKKYIPQLSFILICFLIITYIFLSLIPELKVGKLIYYIIYGIVLSSMATITTHNYLQSNGLKSFYAMLVSIAFVFTDSFYVIYNFYLPMKIFLLLNLAIQFGSYFYLVKYFATTREKEITDENIFSL